MELKELLRQLRPIATDGRVAAPVADIERYRSDARIALLTSDAQAAFTDALHSIECGLYGASVVYAWGVLIDALHEVAWRDAFTSVNEHVSARRKPRSRQSIRDIRDYDFIEACLDCGILTNTQQKVLQSMLNERNLAGHVGFKTATRAYAIHFIERVLVRVEEVAATSFPS